MGTHDGHRGRLLSRMLREGLDHFEPHNVLELVLFYAIPRKDTNELAHRLLNRFGSVSAVLDAPYEALVQIDGVGPNAASLLKLIPELSRYYGIDREAGGTLNSVEKVGRYLLPYFLGRGEENVVLLCMDGKYKALGTSLLHRGDINSAGVSMRKLIATAINYSAQNVVLAHNHPGGIALPSKEDIATTRRVQQVLSEVEIRLVDHIIVADQDFVSLAQSKVLEGW